MGIILKRLLILLIIILVATTPLAGCAGVKKSEEASAKAVAKGGAIVVGCGEEPVSLNPFLPDGTSAATKTVLSNVLWGLLVVTPDLRYAPRIAESVPTLENGLVTENPFTVVYKIRKDAVWSDGTPITSWDVRFTWDTIMNTKKGVVDSSGYNKIARVYTPDNKTVKLIFKEPYPAYKDLFSTSYPIMPKHILKGKAYKKVLDELLTFASGPYKFKEWKRKGHITIVRNDRFWGKAPYIDRVTFKFIPKGSERLSKFLNGNLDAIYPLAAREALDYRNEIAGKEIKNDPGLVWEHVGFNLSKQPVSDPNVRKAIANAIDRDRMAHEATGEGEILNSIIVPDQREYYSPAWTRYGHDIEKAQGYLEKAGYQKDASGFYQKDGKPLKITISITRDDPAREKTARIIEENLKAIGINASIRSTNRKTFFDSWIPTGNYQMALWAWRANPEPELSYQFSSDETSSPSLNYYRYSDKTVNDMLRDASSATNASKRALLYRKIQEEISEDIVVIPLYCHPQIIAYSTKIGGVKNNVSLEGPFWNLGEWWVSKE